MRHHIIDSKIGSEEEDRETSIGWHGRCFRRLSGISSADIPHGGTKERRQSASMDVVDAKLSGGRIEMWGNKMNETRTRHGNALRKQTVDELKSDNYGLFFRGDIEV